MMRSPDRGRGADGNPGNRFVPIELEAERADGDGEIYAPEERIGVETRVFRDAGRTLITTNRSPDVGFEASLNPYRGCEHGCIYCYARPTHEYFGLSAGLDFETRLFAKTEAARLLARELEAPAWTPKVLALSGVTDPYQPVERRLGITRSCLEVLARFRNPVSVITKSHLVVRDLDLLGELADHGAARVYVSITTLDDGLRRTLEPRTASPRRRLQTITALTRAGIPTGVMVAPVLPGLTESEIPAILQAAAGAGAIQAGYIVLRLPHGVAALFEDWLERHRPDARTKVLNRIKSLRGGRLNDPRFGSRMRGEGVYAREIRALFDLGLRRAGFPPAPPPLRIDGFRRPAPAQFGLFD